MFLTRCKRETGFEILRIIAMFLIGAVHVMNYGGMLANSLQQTIMWQKLIYSFFIISVNIFVLISAYFMVNSKIKVKKLALLWAQTITYAVISYLIFSLIINNNFSISSFASCSSMVLSSSDSTPAVLSFDAQKTSTPS